MKSFARRLPLPRLSAGAVIAAMFLLAAAGAHAAEIKLRDQCVCLHSRVQLGDVADIHANEQTAEDLRRIDLCSAPRRGRPRTIDVREIRELLALYGFEMSSLRFAGERQVVVYARDDAPAVAAGSSFAGVDQNDRGAEEQSRRAVSERLREFLNSKEQAYWEFDVDLSRGDLELLAGGAQIVRVGGGTAPWIGRQRFELLLQTSHGETTLPVTATVRRPDTVFVAARALERGSLISAADVTVQPAAENDSDNETSLDWQDLVGMQAARTIAAGQTLDQQMVQQPVLIERGKIVTVVAIAAGVKVTTEARALDNGSRGDLIRLQPLENGEKYAARVVGFNQAEVYAQGPTARPSPAPQVERRASQRANSGQPRGLQDSPQGVISRAIRTQ